MASLKEYLPDEVSIVLGAILVDGYADGEFVSVEHDENDWNLYQGASGDATRARSNKRSATIAFTVQQTAECNDLLSALRLLDLATGKGKVPLLIRDGSGRAVFAAEAAWIEKAPTASFSGETQTRTWTIRTHELVANHGGN